MLLFILLIFLFFFYMFIIAPRLSKKEEMKAFLHTRFAHRGYHCAERLIPENSIPAFQAALDRHYGIELDLHLCKDNQLVVFHDDNLKRICGVNGRIEEYTYDELQNFHLLNTTEKIPLFADVPKLVRGRVPLLIELKIPSRSIKICQETQRLLEDYKGTYLIQSFNTMGLNWFKKNAPQVLRGQLSSNLTAGKSDENFVLRFLVKHLLTNILGKPDFISYKMSDLPALNVSICHRLFKTPIAVWTLRTEDALETGIQYYDMQIFEKKKELY